LPQVTGETELGTDRCGTQGQVSAVVLARLMPSHWLQAAAARAENLSAGSGSGSPWKAVPPAACGKTRDDPSQRRTAVSASEDLTTAWPGHWTEPRRSPSGRVANRSATTEYRPNRPGPARRTVSRHQPRVASRPRGARASRNVVSMVQRQA